MAQAQPYAVPVATLDADTRAAFMVRVYQHLVAALIAFIAFETLLFATGAARVIYDLVAGSSGAWLLVLGGFMVVNWMATAASHDLANPGRQYGGLFAIIRCTVLI